MIIVWVCLLHPGIAYPGVQLAARSIAAAAQDMAGFAPAPLAGGRLLHWQDTQSSAQKDPARGKRWWQIWKRSPKALPADSAAVAAAPDSAAVGKRATQAAAMPSTPSTPQPPVTQETTPLSARELGGVAAQIQALSQTLAGLNSVTQQRLAGLEPPEVIPVEQRFRNSGDRRQLAQLSRSLQDRPDDLGTVLAIVELLRRNHKFRPAEDFLQRALNLDPLNQSLLHDLGSLYLERGETTRAWRAFQEILYINPGSVEGQLALGLVRDVEGAYADADAIYARVEEQSGLSEELYGRRSASLLRRGEYRRAVELSGEGAKQFPESAELYAIRGRVFLALGMLERAKTDLYNGLALDEELAAAYGSLGQASFQEGNYPAAVRAFQKQLELVPGAAESSLNLGRAYLMNLQLAEAVEEFETLKFLKPEHESVDSWLAQAAYLRSLELNAGGQSREALISHGKAMAATTEDSRYWITRALLQAGQAAREQGQYERSLNYYTRAVEMNPFDLEALVGLSRTHQDTGNFQQALAFVQRALELDPHHDPAQAQLRQLSHR